MSSDRGEDIELSPIQAAIHLGITPELLFGYTSSSFERSSGLRSLATVESNGSTAFKLSELDEFDRRLAEPWVEEGASRITVPKCIVDHLRAESGNRCSRCGSGVGVETAHIIPWEICRGHHPGNLIRICSACHSEHDRHQSLPSLQLIEIKRRLVASTRDSISTRANPLPLRFHAPAPADGCVGYAEMTSSLTSGLQAARCILVVGVGGVGKTQLARRALHSVETRRPVIWIDVEKYASRQQIEAVLRIALGSETRPCGREDVVSRLDEMQACVVFDGIESGTRHSLEDLEDFVTDLATETARTQFLITSQVELQRVPFESTVRLLRLDPISSRDLLLRSSRDGDVADLAALAKLISFCDGHPLTIRLVGGLISFFGSAAAALARILKFGAEAIRLQRRMTHDRTTSLSVCLALAYEALDEDESRILAQLCYSPGGLFTAFVTRDSADLVDAQLSVAGLRHWSLIHATDAGRKHERLHMLSPVRAYVGARWNEQKPEAAKDLRRSLYLEFAMMAAVIDDQCRSSDDVGYMVYRYAQELPNLLKVVEASCESPHDERLADATIALCGALMRYFFLLGFADEGIDMMNKAADLNLSRGRILEASNSTVQLLALSHRGRNRRGDLMTVDLLRKISKANERDPDPKVHANVFVAKAMRSLEVRDNEAAERWSRDAISIYSTLQTRDADEAEERSDDTAAAYNLLGGALLAQRRYAEAKQTYLRCFELQSDASSSVNNGQLLHQLGNCESHLGEHMLAIGHYAKAAGIFQSIGMQEYLSNALSELGHALVECRTEPSDLDVDALFRDGVIDVTNHAGRCFDSSPASDDNERMEVVRKLFGMLYLFSLSRRPDMLSELASTICKRLPTLFEPSRDWSQIPSEGSFVYVVVNLALDCGEAADTDLSDPQAAFGALQSFAFAVHGCGAWAGRFGLYHWLAAYGNRKLSFKGLTAERLEIASKDASLTGIFSLD